MKNKKQYTAMKITKLGDLDELTMLGQGKSGVGIDGNNMVGNRMDMM